jgi:uncharacterized OB-fold protein
MIEHTAETRPFWEGLAAGRLLARRCLACGTVQQTPRLVCACGSSEGTWIDLPPTALLVSHTRVAHAPADRPYLPSPYTLGLVAFPEAGIRMLALITGDDARIAVGDPVDFESFRSGDVVLPAFRTGPAAQPERGR